MSKCICSAKRTSIYISIAEVVGSKSYPPEIWIAVFFGLATPANLALLAGQNQVPFFGYEIHIFDTTDDYLKSLNWVGLLVSGLLVGVGTKLAGDGPVNSLLAGGRSVGNFCYALLVWVSAAVAATLRFNSGVFSSGKCWGADFDEFWTFFSIAVYVLIGIVFIYA